MFISRVTNIIHKWFCTWNMALYVPFQMDYAVTTNLIASVSVSNFETTIQKSQSQYQNANVGLAHHRFWNPQRKLISCQLFINFYVRMWVQGQIKLLFFFQYQKSQYQSQCLRLMLVSVSVLIFDTKNKSLRFRDQFIKSRSQNSIPTFKVSVSKIESGWTESQYQSQHAKNGLAHPLFTGQCPPPLVMSLESIFFRLKPQKWHLKSNFFISIVFFLFLH